MKKNTVEATAFFTEWLKNEAKREEGLSLNELIEKPPPWFKLTLLLLKRWTKLALLRSEVFNKVIEMIIDNNDVGQIIEFGSGWSDRGLIFSRLYPVINYIDTDLPTIIDLKNIRIENRPNNYYIKPFNVVTNNIGDLFKNDFNNSEKTIFIFEGLALYLSRESLSRFLGEIRFFLKNNGGGYVLFDAMHKEDEKTKIVKFLRWFVCPFFKEIPVPNFDNMTGGEEFLRKNGFNKTKTEKQGIINFYCAAIT